MAQVFLEASQECVASWISWFFTWLCSLLCAYTNQQRDPGASLKLNPPAWEVCACIDQYRDPGVSPELCPPAPELRDCIEQHRNSGASPEQCSPARELSSCSVPAKMSIVITGSFLELCLPAHDLRSCSGYYLLLKVLSRQEAISVLCQYYGRKAFGLLWP
jgi:hypothetical protein